MGRQSHRHISREIIRFGVVNALSGRAVFACLSLSSGLDDYPAGVVYDQPVSALDIVPTAAAAAGVSLPTDRVYDGLNMIPYLAREQVAPPRTLFWRWFGLGSSGPPGSSATIYAVRSDSLKLVQMGGPTALFNLCDGYWRKPKFGTDASPPTWLL